MHLNTRQMVHSWKLNIDSMVMSIADGEFFVMEDIA